MYYNFKKVTLIYSTNKEIMEKIGRKLGFSHEKNQFVPIDTPFNECRSCLWDRTNDVHHRKWKKFMYLCNQQHMEKGCLLSNNGKQYLCF